MKGTRTKQEMHKSTGSTSLRTSRHLECSSGSLELCCLLSTTRAHGVLLACRNWSVCISTLCGLCSLFSWEANRPRVILEPIKPGWLQDFESNKEEFLNFVKSPRTSYWEYSVISILSSSEFNTTIPSDLPINLVQGC